MDRYSLLGHLVPGIIAQRENVATESLLYLLRRYGTAHEAFVDLASTVGYAAPSALTFDTQVHMEHGNIPDLVGATADGEGVLLVESKFWAPLTPNQPTGYLRRLPEGGEGMVLFVAPEGRYQTLWPELVARCREEGIKLRDETGEPPNWRTVHTSGGGRLAFVSWSFVLDHLEGRLKGAEEDLGAHEIWQLEGLCRRLDDEAFRPLKLGEDPSGSERRRAQLRSMVDDVVKRLVESGVFDIKGYRATPGPRSYRRYGTLSGRMNWFVGYNEEYAARFGGSFLWVGGPSGDTRTQAPLPGAGGKPRRSYELGTEVLFPLGVPVQEEHEHVIRSLVAQVEGVVELLPKRERT